MPENKGEELYDNQDKATQLRTVVRWDGYYDGVFAGRGKRICSATGCRSERQSSHDEGSVAELWRKDETICGYLLPGRRGVFRTARVCAEVSGYQRAFHRHWRGEWSNAGLVRSSAENVQEDPHRWSARSDWDER